MLFLLFSQHVLTKLLSISQMPASSFNLPYGSSVARKSALPENGNWWLSTAIRLWGASVPPFRLNSATNSVYSPQRLAFHSCRFCRCGMFREPTLQKSTIHAVCIPGGPLSLCVDQFPKSLTELLST